jgi:vancomycin resistance protein YoaR
MEISNHLLWKKRLLTDKIINRDKFFAKKRVSGRNFEKYPYIEVSQPIIKPSGQEDIFHNKIHNIKIVMDLINQIEMNQGEIFSFWRLIGNPTTKKGFKEASIFLNNKVTRDVGGGLCQISTAIYGAALHSGCEILERSSHSIDAYGEGRYFPLGQDATISYPRTDLQFQNPFHFPIVLHSLIEDNLMKVRLFLEEKNFEVSVNSQIKKIIPRETIEISSGSGIKKVIDEGSDGKIVETLRIVRYDNGAEKEYKTVDFYKPMPKIIR